MKIVATNLGGKTEIDWKGKKVTTGIFKYPVDKPIFLDVEDVRGDTICNREKHGGIDQAVYAFSEKHYDYFKKLYPDLDFELGMFGENLTLSDLDETKIHVGDQYKVGEVLLEVTKPRQPCMKLGVRFNDMSVVKEFWKTSMSGVYFKVLQTGFVEKGAMFEQLTSNLENPTIAEVYAQKRARKS